MPPGGEQWGCERCHDPRGADPVRGDAAEYAGLGAVGVHDVWLVCAQQGFDAA